VAARGIAPRAHAVKPQLAELARGRLEGRPVFLLLLSERKAGLERRQARLTKGAEILHAGAPSLPAFLPAALRINQRRARYCQRRGSRNNGLPHGFPPALPNVEHSTNRNAPSSKLKLC